MPHHDPDHPDQPQPASATTVSRRRPTPRHRTRSRPQPPTTVLVTPRHRAHPTGAAPAVLRTLVLAYTRPGHRVLLADPSQLPAGDRSTQNANRLTTLITRLGRRVSTDPAPLSPPQPEGNPQPNHPVPQPQPDTTLQTSADLDSGSGRVGAIRPRFALIITSINPAAVDTALIAGWAADLTRTGTLAVLTHRNRPGDAPTDPDPGLTRAVTDAGLVLADRLILLLDRPQPPGTLSPSHRRAVLKGGHRPIHSTALIFTRGGGA